MEADQDRCPWCDAPIDDQSHERATLWGIPAVRCPTYPDWLFPYIPIGAKLATAGRKEQSDG